jgi:chemotaxis response regulator CheB
MGASAGGLEAFEQFFSHLPLDTGLAFVLVPHLEPTHKGMMPELLGRHTKMPVVEVEDGMKVQPNHVYVIPPNADLAILHGKLQVLEPVAPRGQRMASTSSSGIWPRTRRRKPSGLFSLAWEATARWG